MGRFPSADGLRETGGRGAAAAETVGPAVCIDQCGDVEAGGVLESGGERDWRHGQTGRRSVCAAAARFPNFPRGAGVSEDVLDALAVTGSETGITNSESGVIPYTSAPPFEGMFST